MNVPHAEVCCRVADKNLAKPGQAAGSTRTLQKNPRGYCPNHATGVKLPDDFVVKPLQYVD